jgi:hypothetical protein
MACLDAHLISFTYYIDYKHNLSKQLSANFTTWVWLASTTIVLIPNLIVIYDQFKLVSDPSSNIREVTK